MPKKSRAARTFETKRVTQIAPDSDQKRVKGPGPLVITASDLADAPARPENSLSSAASVASTVPARPLADTTRPNIPVSSANNVLRPGTARTTLRRTATVRQPVISREDEFNFVRSDLRTVLILTVLMVIALVVLTILLGR